MQLPDTKIFAPHGQHPLRLFVSFCPSEADLKDALLRHLNILCRIGDVRLWTMDDVRAGEEWQTEVNLQPDNYKMALRLSHVYLQQRDWRRTVRTLSRCLELTPSDPEILTMLAQCFEGLNERPKAIKVWVEAARQNRLRGNAEEERKAYDRALALKDIRSRNNG
jgi:predicted Zn-dependent protease